MNNTLLPSPRPLNWALLIIRIAASAPFLFHGSQILFGWFGGPGVQGFATDLHLSVIVSLLVGLAQFFGGLAVLTGVLTRLGAICTLIVMIGAIMLVHVHNGYDVSKGGMEYPITNILVSIALIITGGGDYTLMRVFPSYRRPHAPAVPQA